MFKIKKTSASSWTTLPEPMKQGVTITDEPIWSKNTGRNCDGKMVGDIKAWKTTVQVKWPALTFSEAQTIVNALTGAGPFFDIRYNDLSSSQTVDKTVYCSNIPRTMYSLVKQYHLGVEVTFIEQ